MYDLHAKAYQTRTGIYVHMVGLLANTCMRAKVEGTYPGTIMHIMDPGHGEVFIREWRDPAFQFCAQHLVPWQESAMLAGDTGHKSVAIYVNGEKKLDVKVEGAIDRGKSENDFVVTALVGSKDPPFHDCAIHHADDIIPKIYRRVFGPDRKASCEKFISKNCEQFAKKK